MMTGNALPFPKPKHRLIRAIENLEGINHAAAASGYVPPEPMIAIGVVAAGIVERLTRRRAGNAA